MTILVIDDHEDVRIGLSHRLKHSGHRPLSAENAQDALDLLNSVRFDAIILDMMMPAMDGNQFLQSLRQLPGKNDLRVIVHTANLSERVKAKALELGVQDYVTKRPDSWDELMRLLSPAAVAV